MNNHIGGSSLRVVTWRKLDLIKNTFFHLKFYEASEISQNFKIPVQSGWWGLDLTCRVIIFRPKILKILGKTPLNQ